MQPTADTTSFSDQLDELSTRLILDGPSSLTARDFEEFGERAAALSHDALRLAAQAIAACFLPGSQVDLTTSLAAGIEQLRSLVLHPPSAGAPQLQAPQQAGLNHLAGDEDLILEFITEAEEHLVNIEGQMLVLEDAARKESTESDAAETLNTVFRAFHTIKGLAGFLEFSAIQALAHEVETLLDTARNGHLAVTPAIVDIVLESTDIMRQELQSISLRLEGKPAPQSNVDEDLLGRIRTATRNGTVLATNLLAETKNVSQQPDSIELVGSALPAASRPERRSGDFPAPRSETGSVRIETAKLDQLMDMIGEMVIAQTLIGHSPALASVEDARLRADLTQLARITADVQRITTGMRMVPIGLQFQKTARVIRDLSRRAGKEIVLETSGEDTEVDKTIAEDLSDPLLHMVRNSIDHGIEGPAERAASGKHPVACIRLAAYHKAGQIVIAITDDGRGLNRQKIFDKAVERGLIQPNAVLTDNEIFLLIFEAGFSTAEKVTDISGRGVGMDVVRRNVQALRGRIEVQSQPGHGTTFLIKLPLTLAIIEGLIVNVGDQRYVAPIFSVKEMFRPTPDMISTVHGKSEMVLVRDQLLPVVRLHERFNKQPRTALLTEGTLIVAEAEGRQFCLFVDDLVGKQEVVIKSLGPTFREVVGITGCAILGDGRVGLILDMPGIYKGQA